MGLVDIICSVGKLFPKPRKHTDARKKAIEKEIVARYGRGNASLQQGMYITAEEIKKKKKNLASYHF